MSMTHRESEELSRIFLPRDESVNYLDEESDDEIDYVHEESEESSEYNCSDDDDSEDERERDIVEDEEETGRQSGAGSRKKKFVYGKNGHKWSTELPDPRGRRSTLVIHLPGRKSDSPCNTPFDFGSLLFTDAMLDIVVKYTNAEIETCRESNKCTYPPAQSTNVTNIEIQAYIGLLDLSGLQKQNNIAIDELWSAEFVSIPHKNTMTGMRFKFISARLRFDDDNIRITRREIDILALIREIWDALIENCQTNYTPSDFLTIEEQLLGFRGRFSARVYIKSKPAKYGINIVTLNDAQTFYLFNAIPYC